MKNVIRLHSISKRFLIIGVAAVITVLLASAVFHFGAGRMFEYYSATDISETLLAGVRPLSVAVCTGSVGIEYLMKRKDDN